MVETVIFRRRHSFNRPGEGWLGSPSDIRIMCLTAALSLRSRLSAIRKISSKSGMSPIAIRRIACLIAVLLRALTGLTPHIAPWLP